MTATVEPLVGRETELELLDGVLEDAAESSSRFVVITGEAGIGKTRLLSELASRAVAREYLALEGRAVEFERDLPFGVVVDAFDAHLERLDAATFDRLAADGLEELSAVFPAMRTLGSVSAERTTAAERFRAYNAVRELIERLAARRPLVVALDDLHWADRASIELIAHLLRRPPQAGVAVAAAFRTGRADPMLVDAIERASRDGVVDRIRLGPLAAEEAQRLLREATKPELERLYHESGGNPLYFLQLARVGVTERATNGEKANGSDGGVPGGVAASIEAELETVPDRARAFAEAAAVAGDPFDFDLAAAIAAADEGDALDALDELVARQLIQPGDFPRQYRFSHPLVRHAVYDASTPGKRLQAHRRAADALEGRGASAMTRAHHVEQSAHEGDEAAVAVLREAGEATSQGAPASAARWFGAAFRLLPETTPPVERIELLAAFAAASVATGRFEEGRSALIEAIELVPMDATEARVGLTVACAAAEQLLGRYDEANTRLETALNALPSGSSPEAVDLHIAMAVGAYYRADYDQVAVCGAPALEIARGLDDPQLTAAAAAVLAFGNAFAGAIGEAADQRREAQTLIDAMSDDEIAQRLDAIVHLAAAEYMLDHYEDGIAHGELGQALARRTGQGELMPLLTPALGSLLYTRGRLHDAAETVERAVDGARVTTNAAVLAWALCLQSIVARLTGDLDAARAAAEEALPLARRRGERLITAFAGSCLADALHESGEPERAVEVVRGAAGGPELPGVPIGWRTHALERITTVLLDLDRQEEAERAADTARQIADALGLPLAGALADRAAAAVALAADDPELAAERALASAAAADGIGARVEAAVARSLAGRALAAAGDGERAVSELERAATELDACGAVPYRDLAERELVGLGRRRPRRTRAGKPGIGSVDSLTDRELEVAQLVVDRRTNREIAGELFLSEKTVESHLRNVFDKLGISSRREVAGVLEGDRRARG